MRQGFGIIRRNQFSSYAGVNKFCHTANVGGELGNARCNRLQEHNRFVLRPPRWENDHIRSGKLIDNLRARYLAQIFYCTAEASMRNCFYELSSKMTVTGNRQAPTASQI